MSKYKEEFKYLLEKALIGKENKSAQFLLTSIIKNDIDRSFLKEFLDTKRLKKLYNNEAVKLDPLKLFFKIINNFYYFKNDTALKKSEPFLRYLNQEKKIQISSIKREDLDYLIEKVIPDLKFSLIPEDEIKINNPEMYLFFWCILSKRIEFAKIFWKFGKVILPHVFLYVFI
jgi:hypothetical protein